MKIVIFGLTISSSWGNGHATLWRGLLKAMVRRGHKVVFFERDVPYYAGQRDLWQLEGGTLHLYTDWSAETIALAGRELSDADAGMVTSYCPDGVAATQVLLASRARLKTFYDLDTPVTLKNLAEQQEVPYIGPRGLRDFDLVLSYTGGQALHELRDRLGARHVVPLYGSVDPEVHRRVDAAGHYRADMSYLGTYATDRQEMLNRLLIEPARRLPAQRFVIGGAQYPEEFPWAENIFFVRHLPPGEHPAFYSSSRTTLNVTRQAMAEMGWCPSGRLFEAAACGVPIISDWWEGLDEFFEPGEEILIARCTEDVIAALQLPGPTLQRMARAAYERVREQHTAERRAQDFEAALEAAPQLSVGV